jgi:hypothetical protein
MTTMMTRMRLRSSGPIRLAASVLLLLLVASACEPAPKAVPKREVTDAPKVAAASGAVLLQLSAYDYALAGNYAGEKVRVVSPDRYIAVARSLQPKLTDITTTSLSLTANAAGPVRDAVVALADSLTDLAKDLGAYSGAGDAGVFAKIGGDVTTAWDRLKALAAKLPPDPELQKTLARGPSITVTATSEPLFALSAGPYATAADADAAAKKIGPVISVSRTTPFAVRVATYPAKPPADAAAVALKTKGIDVVSVAEERSYAFVRGGSTPDAELWREPSRVVDGPGGARRVALSSDTKWIAMAADDGTVAIFSADGVLRALPKFPAGITALLFSGDGGWLFAGGASATVLFVPSGQSPLTSATQMRFPSAITQVQYIGVPTARAFVAISKGAGGAGLVGARAPDGAVLGDPFPIATPATGGFIAVSDSGEILIATVSGGGTDVEVLRLGRDRAPRGVIRIPGAAVDLAIDAKGDRGAIVTDQGTYRFSPHATDPGATLQKVGAPVRDVAFGPDGTFLQMDKDKVTATGADGAPKWRAPIADGRKLVAGVRTLVWDGPDVVWAIASDGTVDALGVDGTVQDVVTSADGKRAAVVTDARRALVFELQ